MGFETHRDCGDENDFKLPPVFPNWHTNLSPKVNNNLQLSAIEGGAWLKQLAQGKALRIVTQHSTYTIRKQSDGRIYLLDKTAGERGVTEPQYPVLCQVNGSTWGGSMLKAGFVGRGMHLEIVVGDSYLTTSKIQSIEEIQ